LRQSITDNQKQQNKIQPAPETKKLNTKTCRS